MVVGLCKAKLRFPGHRSLKEKRATLQSLLAKMDTKFNLAVAQVDLVNEHEWGTIGFACVSNERGHADRVIAKTVDWLEEQHGGAVLWEYEVEVLNF